MHSESGGEEAEGGGCTQSAEQRGEEEAQRGGGCTRES